MREEHETSERKPKAKMTPVKNWRFSSLNRKILVRPTESLIVGRSAPSSHTKFQPLSENLSLSQGKGKDQGCLTHESETLIIGEYGNIFVAVVCSSTTALAASGLCRGWFHGSQPFISCTTFNANRPENAATTVAGISRTGEPILSHGI